ncbi:unnamed protein product [Dovyalis caffra]|uniref:Uncharacterized protein n=1 Tax=Dovyalis caffra TaxID=77055 RepID=A0AAV1QRK9_9ROSI|nr:unnamed protein product [Dovyalis caffra]
MERSLRVKKGAWTEEEDILLRKCVEKYGEGRWHQVPLRAGLNRCRKSCRMRWLNYLKPNIKRGGFSVDELDLIIRLHKLLGNRQVYLSTIGRTANDVKNYWNTNLRKKMDSSNKDVKSKPEPKSITKATIIKPRPRNFKNISWLREGTPFINVCHPFGDDLCKPYSTMAPFDNNEVESMWWESLLDDKEINITNNNSCLGNVSEIDQEPIKSVFGDSNSPGGENVGNMFYEQGQRCWSDFSSDDADLWNLINTELDQQLLEQL